VGSVSDPGDVSVGPSQYGSGRGDRATCRKLPRTNVFGVDQLDPVRPWSDVEAAGLAEVEEHRPGIVQQGEDPQRAFGGSSFSTLRPSCAGYARSASRMSTATGSGSSLPCSQVSNPVRHGRTLDQASSPLDLFER
jgi:hypothetical protein